MVVLCNWICVKAFLSLSLYHVYAVLVLISPSLQFHCSFWIEFGYKLFLLVRFELYQSLTLVGAEMVNVFRLVSISAGMA